MYIIDPASLVGQVLTSLANSALRECGDHSLDAVELFALLAALCHVGQFHVFYGESSRRSQ